MFDSIFSAASTTTTSVSVQPLLASMVTALVLGFALSWVYRFRSRYTKSFVMTLSTLPAIVAVVIMMINGNVGAGVAVAGGFSLVRFRSVAGQGRDIAFVFLAMCIGLVCGMGYLALAAVVTLVMGAVFLLAQLANFGDTSADANRTLRVTVPEDLDHVGAFEDVFQRYTTYHRLESIKTSNMGSLYKLVYNVGLKDAQGERELIDELRCRNGNLEIAMTHQAVSTEEM